MGLRQKELTFAHGYIFLGLSRALYGIATKRNRKITTWNEKPWLLTVTLRSPNLSQPVSLSAVSFLMVLTVYQVDIYVKGF